MLRQRSGQVQSLFSRSPYRESTLGPGVVLGGPFHPRNQRPRCSSLATLPTGRGFPPFSPAMGLLFGGAPRPPSWRRLWPVAGETIPPRVAQAACQLSGQFGLAQKVVRGEPGPQVQFPPRVNLAQKAPAPWLAQSESLPQPQTPVEMPQRLDPPVTGRRQTPPERQVAVAVWQTSASGVQHPQFLQRTARSSRRGGSEHPLRISRI